MHGQQNIKILLLAYSETSKSTWRHNRKDHSTNITTWCWWNIIYQFYTIFPDRKSVSLDPKQGS